jgi:hypothetical protein
VIEFEGFQVAANILSHGGGDRDSQWLHSIGIGVWFACSIIVV